MSSITKYEEQIAALKARSSSLRQRVEVEAREVQGAAIMAGVGFFFGGLEAEANRTSNPLPTVAGLEPSLAWGVGLTIAGRVVDGRAGELMSDAGKALITISMYKQGQGRR